MYSLQSNASLLQDLTLFTREFVDSNDYFYTFSTIATHHFTASFRCHSMQNGIEKMKELYASFTEIFEEDQSKPILHKLFGQLEQDISNPKAKKEIALIKNILTKFSQKDLNSTPYELFLKNQDPLPFSLKEKNNLLTISFFQSLQMLAHDVASIFVIHSKTLQKHEPINFSPDFFVNTGVLSQKIEHDIKKAFYNLYIDTVEHFTNQNKIFDTIFCQDILKNYVPIILSEKFLKKTPPDKDEQKQGFITFDINFLLEHQEIFDNFVFRVSQWHEWMMQDMELLLRRMKIMENFQLYVSFAPQEITRLHENSRYFKDFTDNLYSNIYDFKYALKNPEILSKIPSILKRSPKLYEERKKWSQGYDRVDFAKKLFQGSISIILANCKQLEKKNFHK
ncbi:MAG: hypothetical protein Tsb0015_11850 [Simkaniaceae bacterium]